MQLLLRYHPEITLIAIYLVSWLVKYSNAHGVPVDKDTSDAFIMCTVYLILWTKRWFFGVQKINQPSPQNDNKAEK